MISLTESIGYGSKQEYGLVCVKDSLPEVNLAVATECGCVFVCVTQLLL